MEARLLRPEKEQEIFEEALEIAREKGMNEVYGFLMKRIYEILRDAGVPLVGRIRSLVGKTAWEIYLQVFRLQGQGVCESLDPQRLRGSGVDPRAVAEAFSCPLEEPEKKKEEEDEEKDEGESGERKRKS